MLVVVQEVYCQDETPAGELDERLRFSRCLWRIYVLGVGDEECWGRGTVVSGGVNPSPCLVPTLFHFH